MSAQTEGFEAIVLVFCCPVFLFEINESGGPIYFHSDVAELNHPFGRTFKKLLFMALPASKIHALHFEGGMIIGQVG